MALAPGTRTPPARGARAIRAFVFDTYGTVCDFYHPIKREIETLAGAKGVSCDAGRFAIDWRTAYAISTFRQAVEGSPFRPLREIQRENLVALLDDRFPARPTDVEIDRLTGVWDRLDPWPDAVPGLQSLKAMAIVAPLSNGNFADMVHLARHARLPWDIVLGSSLAGAYKPHPDVYLKSVAALDLQPEDVCMVAAHQIDLRYAAGHGMQTAFVRRPHEFGGPVKPKDPRPGESYLDAAEIHPEGEWTYVASSFTDLADQVRAVQPIST